MRSFQSFFQGSFPNSFIFCGERKVSYDELFTNAKALAKGFGVNGVGLQAKVVVISQPSIEWIICDFACLNAGFITIPLFPSSSSETLSFQIEDSKPDYLIAENEEVLQKIQNATNYAFKEIFLMTKPENSKVRTIYNIIAEAQWKSDNTIPSVEQSLPAAIIYTSGTSGNPKGVVLTHSNFAHQVEDIQNSYPEITNDDVAISILPMAHVYQRTIAYFYLSRGVTIHIVNDVKSTIQYIKSIQPSLITVVPRVLEKVYAKVKSQIEAKPKVLRNLLLKIFESSSKGIINNKLFRFVFDFILYKKVRKIFGHNIKYIVCGGAKLNSNEEAFFFNARVCILQGYGMTESSPVIASNTKRNHKLYTVGKPLPSVEVKIAKDGEICIRGASVFGGYYGQEPRNSLQFFETGDLGVIDYDGFLSVIGRIKEQFKTANGKFINPVKIESLLNEIAGVENACVIAEGRPFVVAIIFSKRSDVDALQKQINAINTHLEHHEQVQYFYISQLPPTVENNIITPSIKIRRNYIAEKFSSEIEEMYNKIKKA